MTSLRMVVLCAIASLSLACSGGSDGNGSPTEPAVRRDVVIGFYVWNVARQRTLQETRLLLNDQVVATFTATGNGASEAFMTGTVRGVTTGTHTLTVTIVRQTRTPTRYLMGTPNVPNSYAVNRQEGGTIVLTQLPWEEIVLATGESRRYSINVP